MLAKKIRVNRLAGDYTCVVDQSYWELGTDGYDSTWTDILTIEDKKQAIVIYDKEIHIDCLRYDQFYTEGVYDNYFSVKYVADSIYYIRVFAGLGGGLSREGACSALN